MDAKDLEILSKLQENARVANAEIARQIGLAPSAVLERIRRLERDGVVLDYPARLDPPSVGCGTLAFVFVQTNEQPLDRSTAEQLASIPEVLEVHQVAGEDCLLVKLRCASNEDLGRLLQSRIGSIPAVHRTRTTIALATFKESAALPLSRPRGIAAETMA